MKRDQNLLDYFTWNDSEFLLPLEETAWRGLQQRPLANSQTNESTSFPVKNLPLLLKVNSFPCLNLFLLHRLTFQDFHLSENQEKEIWIWWTSTSAQAYLAGTNSNISRHLSWKQRWLWTIQQNPQLSPYGEELIGRISSAVFIAQ